MRGHAPLPVVPSGDLAHAFAAALAGEVRFDPYTRHLFSTDASMYAIEPIGVVFPRQADDVVAAVEIAARFGVPVLPRGAGTSLAGQTVGKAVVLDFSRHMYALVELNPEAGIARVQPGVVQDDLNRAAGRYGLWFAPDTSTSNRATLGGMIGNNSCGSRSARYGMTIDHVAALDVVLSDGSRTQLSAVGPGDVERRARADTLEGRLYRELPGLIAGNADVIRNGYPPHWRRSGGYRVERLLPDSGPFDLSKVVVGSEGTLALVTEATVRLVARPAAITSLAGHFSDVEAALAALDDVLDSGAAVIELVDRFILDLARRSPIHGHLAAALDGQPGALLWVEFYDESSEAADAAAARLEAKWRAGRHGYAVVRPKTPAEQQRFRELRKAGLGLLLAAGLGSERSLAFVEDTAVEPRRLLDYTRDFSRILERHGLRAGIYGHASAGCLHIRPFVDLLRPGEVATIRAVAEEVSELVASYGGMNSSEHGDGLARAEFSRRLFGDELYNLLREVKRTFDPHARLNPGKKVDPPGMTEHLRDLSLPGAGGLRTHFQFGSPNGMYGAANRCMRVGACRRTADAGGTMCPSFMATRDEEHSTRGRANALVRALSAPDPAAALGDDRLHEVLDLCLECKACRRECPVSVDMAMLKAEFLAHYHARHGVPLRARLFGGARTLNRIGSATAPVSNWLASLRPVRIVAERLGGIDRRRPLPRFARETLPAWFERRRARDHGSKGVVIFLADSFTSFSEPHIGRAAIVLLERAGWRVQLAADVCCGRALISKGLLTQAKQRQLALLDRLGAAAEAGAPIVAVEPSCISTLKEELPSLCAEDPRAHAVSRQAHLVDELLLAALEDGSLPPSPSSPSENPPISNSYGEVETTPRRRIILHPHCHQKAMGAAAASAAMLARIPDTEVITLDAGCCGMAGSFGFEREHYDLSMRIGGLRLFPALQAESSDTLIAATGVSCRQQITHGTGKQAHHPVVLLHQALVAEREQVVRG